MTLPPSLRSRILRARRDWAITAAVQATPLGLNAGLHFTGLISTDAWLGWSIFTGLFLASSLHRLYLAQRALRTYDANPAAAYIAEIRNAFGITGRTSDQS